MILKGEHIVKAPAGDLARRSSLQVVDSEQPVSTDGSKPAMRVLLTGVGGPAGICFSKALYGNDGVEVIGSGAGEQGEYGGKYVSRLYQIPFPDAPNYIHALNGIIDEEGIDLVVPLVDEELPVLASHISDIHSRVLISPYETIKHTTDKGTLYKKLPDYLPSRHDKPTQETPVFVKPRVGRGGRDTHIVTDPSQLEQFDPNAYVFQEVLSPPEVSVDTLFDARGKLLVAVPRIRETVDQGICVRGRVVRDDSLTETVEAISQELIFGGVVNFQFMRSGPEFRLMEINARSSGGMGVTVNSGVNIPLLAVQSMRGEIDPTTAVTEGIFPNFQEIIDRQRAKRAKISV